LTSAGAARCAGEFPENRENNREFCEILPSGGTGADNLHGHSMAGIEIPCAPEQGICGQQTGNFPGASRE
jgi:hypothetical protein